MWVYKQRSGALIDPDGRHVATGYSGNGEHKNRPESESIRAKGPIPRATYTIGEPYDSEKVGPFCLRLTTAELIHGRTAFLIHGDTIKAPGNASNGCIILPRSVRNAIWDSGDRKLKVVE